MGSTFHTTIFEATAMVLAIVTLGLAAAYAVQLSKAPLNLNPWTGDLYSSDFHWSTVWAVFFYGTMPSATIIIASLGITLSFLGKSTALYSLAVSAVFFVGWILTSSLWTHCQWWGDIGDVGRFCYQRSIQPQGFTYRGVNENLAGTMTAFSYLCMILYLMYLCMASLAFHKAKKDRNGTSLKHKDNAEAP